MPCMEEQVICFNFEPFIFISKIQHEHELILCSFFYNQFKWQAPLRNMSNTWRNQVKMAVKTSAPCWAHFYDNCLHSSSVAEPKIAQSCLVFLSSCWAKIQSPNYLLVSVATCMQKKHRCIDDFFFCTIIPFSSWSNKKKCLLMTEEKWAFEKKYACSLILASIFSGGLLHWWWQVCVSRILFRSACYNNVPKYQKELCKKNILHRFPLLPKNDWEASK